MNRAISAHSATKTDADATGEALQDTRSRHPSRDCECPACDGANGGLRFCAKCRYNGCTSGKALCGVSGDE